MTPAALVTVPSTDTVRLRVLAPSSGWVTVSETLAGVAGGGCLSRSPPSAHPPSPTTTSTAATTLSTSTRPYARRLLLASSTSVPAPAQLAAG